MTFGQRITLIRKEKSMRQNDLGKLVGTSGDIIGKYERDENVPSLEVATKIAEALNVSLDYLIGKKETILEDSILNRVIEIQSLPDNDKGHILYTLDGLLQNVRTKQVFAK